MPPKSRIQRKTVPAANSDSCCICLEKLSSKDETMFCSGSCQKYLHRYCESVSEQAFRKLSAEDAEPFICFCCFRTEKEKQVQKLLSTVESLKTELSTLKAASAITSSLSSLNDAPKASAANMSLSKPSYSAVTKVALPLPLLLPHLTSPHPVKLTMQRNSMLYSTVCKNALQACPNLLGRALTYPA